MTYAEYFAASEAGRLLAALAAREERAGWWSLEAITQRRLDRLAPRGHPRTPDNIDTQRGCRACRNERKRARRRGVPFA